MRPGKNGLLKQCSKSRNFLAKMLENASQTLQISKISQGSMSPDPPSASGPSAQLPTFVFQPPTSKLVENPEVGPGVKMGRAGGKDG